MSVISLKSDLQLDDILFFFNLAITAGFIFGQPLLLLNPRAVITYKLVWVLAAGDCNVRSE